MTELTNDQINVKVAELRGWEWIPYNGRCVMFPPDFCKKHPNIERCNEKDLQKLERIAVVPRVATCANAAMKLVAHMRAKGWRCRMNNDEETWDVEFSKPDGVSHEYANDYSPALAIAKAFIAANEGRVG